MSAAGHIWYGLVTSFAYPSGEKGGGVFYFIAPTIPESRKQGDLTTEVICGKSYYNCKSNNASITKQGLPNGQWFYIQDDLIRPDSPFNRTFTVLT